MKIFFLLFFIVSLITVVAAAQVIDNTKGDDDEGKDKFGLITLTADGKILVPSNVTRLELGVTYEGTENETASEVFDIVANRASQLSELIKTYDTISIKTDSVKLIRKYDYVKKKRTFIGYYCENYVIVKMASDNDNVPRLLTEANEAGANELSIDFEPSPEAIFNGKLNAIRLALRSAIARAAIVKQELRLPLLVPAKVDVIEQFNEYYSQSPRMSRSASLADSDMEYSSSMPISSGETEISATVNMHFKYLLPIVTQERVVYIQQGNPKNVTYNAR